MKYKKSDYNTNKNFITKQRKQKKITCPISFNNVDKTIKNPDEKPIKICPSPCL